MREPKSLVIPFHHRVSKLDDIVAFFSGVGKRIQPTAVDYQGAS